MGKLTSTLAVRLLDDVSGPAERAGTALQKLGASGAALTRLAKASPEAAKLIERLEALRKAGERLSGFRDMAKGLGDAGDGFRAARSEVKRLAVELAAAKAKADALKGVRGREGDRQDAAIEVRRLERALKGANATLATSKAAYLEQGAAVRAMRRELIASGVEVSGSGRKHLQIAKAQRSIAAATAEANAGLARQALLHAKAKHGADGHDYDEHVRRHGVRATVAAGAAGYVSAHGVVHGIVDTVKAGANYQHEVVALQNAGRTPEEMAEIERASSAATRTVPTATFEENLKVINETTGAFGSLHHAIENLAFMQKSASVLHASAGDKIQDGAGELGNKLARFFEMRGTAGNTEVFQREAAEMVRAMVFTGGNFNPAEMVNFGQQAKSALPLYSERFMSKIVPSLVTEFGGDRAGTAANAFRSVIMGKANDKKQAEEWVRLGLLDPSKAVMKAGHAVSWKAGAVKDTDTALSDPLQWVENTLLPALRKDKVNVDDKLELSKALGTLFRNSNSNMFAEALGQALSRQRLHKDEDNQNKAGTVDEIYQRNISTDAIEASKALSASLESLMSAASAPAMSTAAGGLKTLAEGINAVAVAAKANPGAALAGGTAVAGGALAGSAWLGYKVLTGFGLPASAAALDTSAAALTAAAAELTAAAAANAGKAVVTKATEGAVTAAEGAGAGAAGAGGLTLGGVATGVMLGAGALAGSVLDMATPGAPGGINRIVSGLIYGEGNDPASGIVNDYNARVAAVRLAEQTTPQPWNAATARVLPGASAGAGYKSEVGFSRGMIGDLVLGEDKKSVALPGAGSLAPKVDAHELDGLAEKFGEVKDKAGEVNALTIAPQVDGSGLGTILQQMREIIGLGPAVAAAASGGGGNTGRVRQAQSDNH